MRGPRYFDADGYHFPCPWCGYTETVVLRGMTGPFRSRHITGALRCNHCHEPIDLVRGRARREAFAAALRGPA